MTGDGMHGMDGHPIPNQPAEKGCDHDAVERWSSMLFHDLIAYGNGYLRRNARGEIERLDPTLYVLVKRHPQADPNCEDCVGTGEIYVEFRHGIETWECACLKYPAPTVNGRTDGGGNE